LKKILLPILVILLLACVVIVLSFFLKNCNNEAKVLNLDSVDPTTLDPAISGDSISSQYIMEIYSGLLQLDDKLNPIGDIAKNWDISTDGLTYTFFLRQNVKFQDGRPVTAQDFKYSWERAAYPDTNSQTALTYLGDIVGIKEILIGKSQTASGIKVIDDHTLQVIIDSPKSYFIYKLTYPTSFVVDKYNVSKGRNWWHTPNGTGPFLLSQWTQNQSLTLEKNKEYYGNPANLDRVNYQFYSGNPMDLYETGKIDIGGVSVDYIDAIKDTSGPFYKDLVESPATSLYYIGFDCSAPPFDDINVRKAFNLAIDKNKIVSLVYRDLVVKADGILPPGIPGYNPNLVGLGYNVTKAREAIIASKYGEISNLPSITLTTSGVGGSVGSTLEALVYQWKQSLGVDVNIREIEPEAYTYKLKTEKNQMYDMGWSADYPHPQDFLDILFSTGTNNNYGQYSNSKVDALIEEANRAIDINQSYTLYQQAEQMIVDDAACIPLTFDSNYLLVKPYVKGYSLNPLGFADLRKVTLLPK
jgi:oligopeptide transport system substrate-binding protein